MLPSMAQITIYLPPELEAEVRREARSAKLSLSAFIAARLERKPKKARVLRHFGALPDLREVDDDDLSPLDEP